VSGGKREGAGRPALPDGLKKVGVYIKLPPFLIRGLDALQESRAVLIERACKEVYGIGGENGSQKK
jgi:hypothetical protein